MPGPVFPPEPWHTYFVTMFNEVQTNGVTSGTIGPSQFVAAEDMMSHLLSWFGYLLNAEVNTSTRNAAAALQGPGGNTLASIAQTLAAIQGGSPTLEADVAGILASLSQPGATIVSLLRTMIATAQAQLAQDQDHPADASGVAIEEQTTAQQTNAEAARAQLAPLLAALNVDDPALLEAFDAALAGEGGQWIAFLGPLLKILGGLLQGAGPIFAPMLIAEAIRWFPSIAARFNDAGQVFAAGFADALNALHAPMESVIEGSAGAILRSLQDEMFSLGQTDPSNVDQAAARLLAIAGGFGMASHLVAIGAEKIVGAKHLGFPQLAAYLADAASFGSIARNTVGAQLEAALRSPARRRALQQFRSELPDFGSMIMMFLRREVDEVVFKDYYAQQGWTEDMVARQARAVFRPLTPRELALVFEDGELDSVWAQNQLQKQGLSDDDARIALSGVLTRATKTVRQEFITAVLAAADQGIYSPDQAAGYLREFGVGESHITSLLLVVAHKRLTRETTERISALVSAHSAGAATDEELSASLAALGIDDRARGHHLYVAQVKRGSRVFTSTSRESAASEKRAQTAEVKAALDAYRRFQLDEGSLKQTLEAVGVTSSYADALVQLAVEQRTPSPRLAAVLSPGAELAKEQKLSQEAVLAQLRAGAVDAGTASAELVAAGLDAAAADREVQLVASRLIAPAARKEATTAAQLARAKQRDTVNAAVQLFRGGLVDAAGLRDQFIAAGVDQGEADALVQREVDRLAGERQRTSQRLAASETRKEQTRVANEAAAAFKAGTLDAAGYEQTLVAAGLTQPVAAATVQEAATVAQSRQDRTAQRAATTEASRVLKANQDAAVFAFRDGTLTADELEQQLVNVGTPADLAAAIRAKEEARPKATGRKRAAPVVAA